MMNENGGSIPTDSEEWTLPLLDFILMYTKRRIPPPSTAEIYVEQRNKFRGVKGRWCGSRTSYTRPRMQCSFSEM